MFENNWSFSLKQQSSYARAFLRAKNNLLKKLAAGDDSNTYAGLRNVVDMYRRGEYGDAITPNSLIVCGDRYEVNEEDGHERVAVLFSTENLLLNAYRQTTTGQDMTLAVDTSYRYTWQGYGLLVIKVIDFSQTAHSVAWGLVSKEDADAHVFCFDMMLQEIQTLVYTCVEENIVI